MVARRFPFFCLMLATLFPAGRAHSQTRGCAGAIETARGNFNSSYYKDAKNLLLSLKGCSEAENRDIRDLLIKIELRNDSINLRNIAIKLFSDNRIQEACEQVRKIEEKDKEYDRLAELKRKCPVSVAPEIVLPPSPPPAPTPKPQSAGDAPKITPEKPREPEPAASKPKPQANPETVPPQPLGSSRDLTDTLPKPKPASSSPINNEVNPNQRFYGALALARNHFEQNEFNDARIKIAEARGLNPNDAEARKLELEIELSIDKLIAIEALTAFYSGKYRQTIKACDDLISGSSVRAAKGMAHFYRGAAFLSLYFIEGEANSDLKAEGEASLQYVSDRYPEFRPDWSGISGRIQAQFKKLAEQKKNR
jgi:hypothetical protein